VARADIWDHRGDANKLVSPAPARPQNARDSRLILARVPPAATLCEWQPCCGWAVVCGAVAAAVGVAAAAAAAAAVDAAAADEVAHDRLWPVAPPPGS